MKKTLIFLLVVAFTFVLARIIINDSGYVLLSYDTFTFESSLWAFLLVMALGGVALWVLKQCLNLLLGGASLLVPVTQKSRRRRAQKLSTKGLIQFANGHWKSAQKLLSQAAAADHAPLLNYLTAARAANENADYDACDEYLRKADSVNSRADIAVGITQAELLLSRKQPEQALATLKRLRKKSPKHPYILKLLKTTYRQLSDWKALAKLLPMLLKLKVIEQDAHKQLQADIYNALFDQAWSRGRCNASTEERIKPATDIWQSLSKQQKRDEHLVYSYAECLAKLGADEMAEDFIRRQLPGMYSRRLILLFGNLTGQDTGRQLLATEKLLTERPNDPELLLSLGRISARNQLWGKAKEYLEASLQLQNSVAVHNELGKLLAHLEKHEQSTEHFRKGLELAANNAI